MRSARTTTPTSTSLTANPSTCRTRLQNAGNKADAGFPAQIVFTAPQGTDDPAVKAAIEPFLAQVATIPGVSVISPYSPEGESFNSKTKPISFAEMSYTKRSQSSAMDLAKQIEKLGDKVDVQGLNIQYGGDLFGKFQLPSSELLGVLAAVIILLIAFGSVLAMGLPIGSALFGLGVGMALIGLVSHLTSMPDFAPQMAAMIGLGVGIDYALFITSRYRENLHAGMEPEQAVVDALDSSGRAVIFAGITVVIAPARADDHGPRVRQRPGDLRRARRAGDDARLDHPAAGAARVRRQADRHHVAGGSRSRRGVRRARLRRRVHRQARADDPRRRRRRGDHRRRQLPAVRPLAAHRACRIARRSRASSGSGSSGAGSSSIARGRRCSVAW